MEALEADAPTRREIDEPGQDEDHETRPAHVAEARAGAVDQAIHKGNLVARPR